ncbi:MAG: single-stranded DNA-binding protein [Spirochaetaceae bacterium]|nr:single-stranded DNA-binding protein [Spirochaetaceae bacterium]
MRYVARSVVMDRHPEPLLAAARELHRSLAALRFAAPVHTVYDPLDYAWCGFRAYVEAHAPRRARVLFLGMNPGPFGMAQTGVPFGEVRAARDWLGIDCAVRAPAREHPRRRIQGFACPRSEISGARLWGLFRDRFGTPAAFFRDHFVVNYCPLMFVEASGRNRTPDKLPAAERTPLLTRCDRHLLAAVEHLAPRWLVAVGAFAMRAAERALRPLADHERPRTVRILHPSPASPAANRGWPQAVTNALIAAGIWSLDAL